tara:strand:- start:1086 stop:1751 length:666 start_codon:yes stop_codon:yes gene_type:complete
LNNLILLIGILLSVPIKAECNVEDIINERISYFSSVTFKNDAEFYSDEFRSELKRSLVKKISEFVGTSSEINVNQNKRKRKSKATYAAIALVVDPQFSKCGNIAVISVNKEQYKKAQYDNFKRQLEFHARNLDNFVKSMDENNVTKKLLKEKVKYYTKELNDVRSLLPLVKLNSTDNRLLDQFSKNISVLEHLLDQLKQSKRINWKKLKDGVVDGINDLIG